MTHQLPAPDFDRKMLDIDDHGDIVWRCTRRVATVRRLFHPGDAVLLGWYGLPALDVRHVLETGSWLPGADCRGEVHVHCDNVERARTFFDREVNRQARAAALQHEAA